MCASAPKVSTSNIRQRTNIYDHVYLFFANGKELFLGQTVQYLP